MSSRVRWSGRVITRGSRSRASRRDRAARAPPRPDLPRRPSLSSPPRMPKKKSDSSLKTAAPPASPSRLTEDTPAPSRKELLRDMLLIRRFEERCAEAYALGKIGGFCHLYIGQEAVGVGAISALRDDDYVIGSYRDHGQALARGVPPRAIMSELFDRNVNFLGGHGIVGGHIPLATGVGFAIKYRGGDQVCLCFFGEAAVNGGAF